MENPVAALSLPRADQVNPVVPGLAPSSAPGASPVVAGASLPAGHTEDVSADLLDIVQSAGKDRSALLDAVPSTYLASMPPLLSANSMLPSSVSLGMASRAKLADNTDMSDPLLTSQEDLHDKMSRWPRLRCLPMLVWLVTLTRDRQ